MKCVFCKKCYSRSIFQVLTLALLALFSGGQLISQNVHSKDLTTDSAITTPVEESPKATPEKTTTSEIANTFAGETKTTTAARATTAKTTTTKGSTPAYSNYIQIGGKTLPVLDVDKSNLDAGNQVLRYKNKFLYGHNSSNVFGVLASLPEGTVFTIATNGVPVNYRIEKRMILTVEESAAWGTDFTIRNSLPYEIGIMTCAGQNLGGGRATHRLILMANRI